MSLKIWSDFAQISDLMRCAVEGKHIRALKEGRFPRSSHTAASAKAGDMLGGAALQSLYLLHDHDAEVLWIITDLGDILNTQ